MRPGFDVCAKHYGVGCCYIRAIEFRFLGVADFGGVGRVVEIWQGRV